eukprot:scaffold12585_cov168-Amphora_coffeaeformis.AAC.3
MPSHFKTSLQLVLCHYKAIPWSLHLGLNIYPTGILCAAQAQTLAFGTKRCYKTTIESAIFTVLPEQRQDILHWSYLGAAVQYASFDPCKLFSTAPTPRKGRRVEISQMTIIHGFEVLSWNNLI